jgi:hypothetical protein
VDHTAGLDDVEERKFLTLPGLEIRPLGRPARSQSLHWLRQKQNLELQNMNIFKRKQISYVRNGNISASCTKFPVTEPGLTAYPPLLMLAISHFTPKDTVLMYGLQWDAFDGKHFMLQSEQRHVEEKIFAWRGDNEELRGN